MGAGSKSRARANRSAKGRRRRHALEEVAAAAELVAASAELGAELSIGEKKPPSPTAIDDTDARDAGGRRRAWPHAHVASACAPPHQPWAHQRLPTRQVERLSWLSESSGPAEGARRRGKPRRGRGRRTLCDARDGRVVGAGQVRAARGRDDDDARGLVRAALSR